MTAVHPVELDTRTPVIEAPAATADRVEPVRLLKVVPTLMSGGTEGQVMNLCRSLDRSQFKLELACLRRVGPYVQDVAAQRIPLTEYRIPSFLRAGTFVQQAKFVRHLARRGTQIVHAYNFYGNVFAIPPARLAQVPVVIASIRDLGLYLTPMQKRVQRHVCRLADCVLVNADAVRRWLVEDGYDAANIVVIRNGVDLGRFSHPPEPDRIRCEFGVPRGVPLVAVVSRLNRLKGLEQFLEAAAVVSGRFPQARFLLVGETPPHDRTYLDDLKTLARNLGIGSRVIFAGLRSDVPAFLGSVDVAVMPSLNEALSNALLEAMAAGAPVVATRVGGTAEALIDGETGLLVAPDDVVSLAAAVVRLLEAPALAAELGRAARQSIADRFSIARMAASTEQLYRQLLAHKRKRRSVIDLERAHMDGRSQWSEHSQP